MLFLFLPSLLSFSCLVTNALSVIDGIVSNHTSLAPVFTSGFLPNILSVRRGVSQFLNKGNEIRSRTWRCQVLEGEQKAVEPQCHRAQSSVYLLICQSAPVDYSCLPHGDKLISAVRSLYRSSDRTQEDTNWHSLCRKCAHNPSFGSKRFFEKVALTFRKLPSVARWCAEWNLDWGPTLCKAVLFFVFLFFKKTEHLLLHVVLGRCLLSHFNSNIWPAMVQFRICPLWRSSVKKTPSLWPEVPQNKKKMHFSPQFFCFFKNCNSYSIITELHYSE